MSTIDDRQPPGDRPVAACVVDSGLAHLDRLFEYAVPAELDAIAQPGVRVRVRFAGRDLEGFVVERRAQASHAGALVPLRRVVSAEPVLTAELLAVCRATAARYGGVLGDVLRLAIPKRHAGAERALARTAAPAEAVPPPDPGPWAAYRAGPALLRRITAGEAPQASWLALPAQPPARDWPAALAVAAAAALAGGRGALLVLPDRRDVDRVEAALVGVLGAGRHVRLTADQGPQARYTAWLKVLRGHVQVVVGTRAAAFAPVRRLGLVAWWDDGDDLHEEPRAPYPQVREVLTLRARYAGAALLSAGFTRTVAGAQAVAAGGWADVRADGEVVRRVAPRVVVAGEGLDAERDGPAARAHLPSAAWRVAKAALDHGPVLVQVPRSGYLPALSCQDCREPARCPRCHGPMSVDASGGRPACRWCGRGLPAEGFVCPHCAGRTLRSTVVGARRTAEELGRAFPGVPVHVSGGDEVLGRVGAGAALVIATPGAEPVAEGGYAACLLLDAWALLDRPELDAEVEALRRWAAAAALTRSRPDGGVVVLAGVPVGLTLAPVEALLRWDPGWFAERELVDRVAVRLPPTVRMAELLGSRRAVAAALAELPADLPVDRLGPLPVSNGRPGSAGAVARGMPSGSGPGEGIGGSAQSPVVRVLLRTELADGVALATALAAVRATRSARKEPDPVRIRLDPTDTG